MAERTVTRRALLGAAALLPLIGCGDDRRAPAAATPPPARTPVETSRLRRLERRFDARLGVYALHTGTGKELAHRADERFGFCSTFKGLAAAAVLDRHPLSSLDTVVRFTAADLMATSFITRDHVATGMTLRAICDAAVRFSDGTAGNLLLREVGGPAGLTRYLRSLGDEVTRCDRPEPFVARRSPGDPRDTTHPRAIAADYREIVLGDALPVAKRAFLRDLLERSTTGARRIRAGLPRSWTVADKTGTGTYGTANDVAIAWPPRAAPLVIAVMSRRPAEDAEPAEALLAETAAVVAAALT
jgi:beta-lactamase class A